VVVIGSIYIAQLLQRLRVLSRQSIAGTIAETVAAMVLAIGRSEHHTIMVCGLYDDPAENVRFRHTVPVNKIKKRSAGHVITICFLFSAVTAQLCALTASTYTTICVDPWLSKKPLLAMFIIVFCAV